MGWNLYSLQVGCTHIPTEDGKELTEVFDRGRAGALLSNACGGGWRMGNPYRKLHFPRAHENGFAKSMGIYFQDSL
jgi:hypothetical protein